MRHDFIGFCIIATCYAPAFAYSANTSTSPADFHRNVYALHEQQITRREVRTVVEQGSYEGAKAAGYRYVDTRYFDTSNGILLSHVRRDAVKPELIHIIEVNIYENGRLVRDFGSVSLPWSPLNPVRTFINLHQYNGELHSFRQYDFFGEVGYEFCEGKLVDTPVRISLDGTDINATSTSTTLYKACFDGASNDWAQYKTPH